ncbi:hypothetical protein PVL29_026475 [Vitis rotundifolia]|uniref:Uncharacterized protein n=1 Tax=Vitis rotundifolia TaxID=103349 RepID=A0AA38YGB6_VITRO|nr:hypothetical protein PVL29_026475 [Vitis rotundifolia]
MASTGSPLLHTLAVPDVRNAHPMSCKAHVSTPVLSRRRCLVLLTTALTARELPSRAQDIPLFGLRKKLEKVEEEAEEILKEGIEAAEKGIVTAEKGIEKAEKGIETAEKEIETAVSYNGLTQAGAVVVAEAVGVLVATSVVNAILGPEAQKS